MLVKRATAWLAAEQKDRGPLVAKCLGCAQAWEREANSKQFVGGKKVPTAAAEKAISAWQTYAARHAACLPGGCFGRSQSDIPRSIECIAGMTAEAQRDLVAAYPAAKGADLGKVEPSHAAVALVGATGAATRLAGPRPSKPGKATAAAVSVEQLQFGA